ncbi:MAG: hypothetical protein IT345_11265 [Trueperaceae bacterium]|nr:hypothetical protein [Trueperaceae bacterium]
MRSSARLLAALAALLTSVSLAAAPIRIDDSGVKYSNSDLTTAYLSFAKVGDTFSVVLNDRVATALPVDMDGIPVIVGTNFFGSTTYSGELNGEGPVAVESTGNVVDGVSLEHDGIELADAVAAYQASLASVGESVTVELDGNYAVITSASGLRIVLQDVFDGVKAHIAAG